MKLFFDTEFTGLCKDTTLISIGLIHEFTCFYGVCTDFDFDMVDDWIADNVVSNLELPEEILSLYNVTAFKGTKRDVGKHIQKWISDNFPNESIELVSDVCHYDMVLFIDLFGESAFDLPNNICPACYDINQDILRYLKKFNKDVSMFDAFDENREEFLNNISEDDNPCKLLSGNCKHNSLYDAVIIQSIYNNLSK